jgi:hypothetical protein
MKTSREWNGGWWPRGIWRPSLLRCVAVGGTPTLRMTSWDGLPGISCTGFRPALRGVFLKFSLQIAHIAHIGLTEILGNRQNVGMRIDEERGWAKKRRKENFVPM